MLEIFAEAYAYFLNNQGRFGTELRRHLTLSFAALGISIAAAVPLGILAARRANLAQGIINAIGALRIVPSLAILFLVQPYLGIGFWPALIALTVLALPPVLVNTYAGVRGVDAAAIEAARGMGMSAGQVLRQIELPLALPAVVAGVRIAAVEVISSASLAAFIGGGGLGIFVTRGFGLLRPDIMLVGAVPVALLALAADALLGATQRRLSPPT
jgi:osmoprotectant transport system permease protein